MSRARRIGIAAVLAAALCGQQLVAASTASATSTTVDDWATLTAAFAAGGDVVLDADIDNSSNPGDPLPVGAGLTVTLDLNGHTLSVVGVADGHAAIAVVAGTSLTVTDSAGAGHLVARTAPGSDGAAIGGERDGGSGSITVTAGDVVAAAHSGGAAIGTGATTGPDASAAGPVIVSGGRVQADSDGAGAAIGGGRANATPAITISGGSVTATAHDAGPGIGSGTAGPAGGALDITGGTVTAGNDGSGATAGPAVGGGTGAAAIPVHVGTAGELDLDADAAYAGAGWGPFVNEGTTTVGALTTLTVPDGATLDNSGTLSVSGTVAGTGSITNSGSVVPHGSGSIANDGQGAPGVSVTGNNVRLEFDVNGGPDQAPPARTVLAPTVAAAQQSLADVAPPTGAVFRGWYNAATGGDRITDATALRPRFGTGPVTARLYARYATTQHIDFTSTPGNAGTAAVGTSYTVTATGGGSGQPVRFSADDSTTNSACTVTGDTVVFRHVGTCVVAADQDGDDAAGFAPAPRQTQTIFVARGDQELTFTTTPPTNARVGDAPYRVAATGGGSGEDVFFSVGDDTTNGACTVYGDTVTIRHSGVCEVAADQGATDDYRAASTATQTFAVGTSGQTIVFSSDPPDAVVDGADYTPAVSGGGSHLPVVLSVDASSTAGVCTVDADTVSFHHTGRCVVAADQAGNDDYDAAPTQLQTITVARAGQTVTFTSPAPANATTGGTYVPAVTSTSGGPVDLAIDASSDSGVCTLDGATVTYRHPGTCVVSASQAGDADHEAANATQTIDIARASQLISITTVPDGAAVDGDPYTVAAVGGPSGNPVQFAVHPSTTNDACTIDGAVVRFHHAGRCVLAATQAGNDDYEAAPTETQAFEVDPGTQTIVFDTVSGAAVGGQGTVHATGGASGQPVTFTLDAVATTNSACTLDGTTVTFVHVGTCALVAHQNGNTDYEPAWDVTQNITVTQGTQNITFTTTAPTTAVVDGEPYQPATTGGNSANPVTITIDPTTTDNACELDTDSPTLTVRFTHVGTCVIAADQPGNTDYQPATTTTQSFTIGQGSQSIAFIRFPADGAVGTSETLLAVGGGSGNDITFTIDPATTNNACTITASSLTYRHTGTCTITATQPGNTDYTDAIPATLTITVGRGEQTLTFDALPPGAVVGGEATLHTTPGASSAAVVLSVDTAATTNGACTVDDSDGDYRVRYRHVGTCTVQAVQAGDADYTDAAVVRQSTTVARGSQSIVFWMPTSVHVGDLTLLHADGGASGNPVTFTVDATTTNNACSVEESDGAYEVQYDHVGNCVLVAAQAGNDDWDAAWNVELTVNVEASGQTIFFLTDAPTDAVVGGSTYTVSTLGGRGGAPVVLAVDPSTTNGACTLAGDVVTFEHVGTCVITASQSGTSDYTAADTVTQSFAVGRGAPVIAFDHADPDVRVGDVETLTVTGHPEATFALDPSTTNESCVLTGDELRYEHAGTCAVTAALDETDDYAAGTTTRTVQVARAHQAITFDDFGAGATVGGTETLHAIGGASANPVTFSAPDAACTVDGNTVTYVHAGTCTIVAHQDGTDDYEPAWTVSKNAVVARHAQAITFVVASPDATAGTSMTLSATGGASGEPVTYSVDTPVGTDAVCSVLGDTVTFVHVGTCALVAHQNGNTDYEPAWDVTQNITVTQGTQNITFTTTAPTTAVVDGEPYQPATTGGNSANPVTITIDPTTTDNACELDTDSPTPTVRFTHVGTCVIAADQPGNTDYQPATTTTQSFTIGQGSQSIAFIRFPADGAVGTSETLLAVGGGSGNDITFTIDPATTNNACTITASSLTYRHTGTCTITATQPGNTDYTDAIPATLTITVGPGEQTIELPTLSGAVVGTTIPLTATGGPSSSPVTFEVGGFTTNDACVVDAGEHGWTLRYQHTGVCVVVARQAGDADYADAHEASQSVVVGKGTQTIDLGPLPATTVVGGGELLHATGGPSGNPVTFTLDPSSTTGACSLTGTDEGTQVHYDHVGTCTVVADQNGTDDWFAAWSTPRTVTITKGAQTITFDPLTASTVGSTETPHSTGGGSGQPVTYTVDPDTTNDSCVLEGGDLRYQHVGTCVVTAHQAGNDDYTDGFLVTQSVEVVRGAQSIVFAPFGADAAVGGSETMLVTGGASGNPVTLALGAADPDGACTLDGDTVTYVHAGTCTVTAHQDGTGDYEPAWDVSRTVTVAKATQTITFDALGGDATVYGSQTLHAIGGASHNPVTFSVAPSTTNAACTVDGDTVTFVHAGTCAVAADQTGDADHADAWTSTRSVTVARAPQTITFDALPGGAVVGGTATLSATGGRSGNPVSFSVDPDATSNSACTVGGGSVVYSHAGLCAISADQAGDADHADAVNVTRTVTVGRAAQSLEFTSTAPTDAVVGGPTHHLSATGGASGNAPVFSVAASSTNSACTVTGADVNFAHAGTCVIAVDQAGSADYLAAPSRSQSFSVGRGTQTITFDALSGDAAVGASETLHAVGGPSGAPVTVAVDAATTNSACTVIDGHVQYRHVGSCVVTAAQTGTSDYTAAVSQTRQVDVGRGTQNITFDALPGGAVVGDSAPLHAVGGASGQPVTYSVDADTTGTACTVAATADGFEVRYHHVGRCVLDARQDGNADYFDAWSMQRSVTVGQAAQSISFTSTAPTDAVVGNSYVVAALGGGSGAPVTFGLGAGTTNNACTVSGSTVTFQHVGTCAVAADQAGNADYLAAATGVQSVVVGRHAQSIAFTTAVPTDAAVGNAVAVAAVGGDSGAPVTFTRGAGTTNGACTVSGSTVTFDHVGTCVVAADQAGTADYLAASPQTLSFPVGKGVQSIDFTTTAPVSATVGATPYLVAAAGAAGTAPITFTVDGATTNGACTVSGSTVTFRHVGTCAVAADRAADADHIAAATRLQSFAIAKGTQTIDFTAPAVASAVDGTTTLQATGGAAGTPVTFTVDATTTNSACSLSGSIVTYRHVGTCVLVAQQLGDADYADAWPVQRSVTVGKGAQSVVFAASAPTQAVVGGTAWTPQATGASSGNPVVFAVHTSTTRSSCSIDAGGSVVFAHAGTCVIAADQAADADHLAAPTTTLSIPVVRAIQSIDVTASTTPKVDATAALQAQGGRTGATVTLAVGAGTTNASCLVSGTVGSYTIAFKHAGTCVVSAAETGDADYLPYTGTRTFTVAKGAQNISVTTSAPATATVGDTYRPTATAPAGTVTVATTGTACSASAGVVTFDHQGTCTVTLDQAGAADYDAADRVSQTVTVAARPTTASVSVPSSTTVFGQAVRATATVALPNGGTPSGAVQFAVDGVASGTPVTLVGGSATSAALTGPGGAVLRPGSREVTARFVPVDATVNAASVAVTTQLIRRAGTTAGVSVSATKLTATVDVVAPGAGAPSGTVTFTVAGSPVGTADVLRGTATLAYVVPSGAGRQVAAVYNGDDLFTSSSASITRQDPVVVATVTSPSTRNAAGWYRGPVTVQFTCAPNGAPLVTSCPDPVVLDTDGAAQSVSRTVLASDGGAQTVVVNNINIDRVVPRVTVSGVKNGGVYSGTTPKPACTATDAVSGVATCTLSQTSKTIAAGRVYSYRVTALDKAGNTSTANGTYSVLTRYLSGATYRSGAFEVKIGKTYTVVVTSSSSRPTYYKISARTPTVKSSAFRAAGSSRWTLPVGMSTALRAHTYWYLGVRIGNTIYSLKLKIVR